MLLLPEFFTTLMAASISPSVDIPVDKIMGLLKADTYLSNLKLLMSIDAILKNGTFKSTNKSTKSNKISKDDSSDIFSYSVNKKEKKSATKNDNTDNSDLNNFIN